VAGCAAYGKRISNLQYPMSLPCYLAKLPTLPETTDGLESIQLFPPGGHDIVVTNAAGKSVPLTVDITAETAAVLETARAKYQAEADGGTGDAPFLDFNHEDREASAWVKAIAWAGDDPQTGGVRAAVELSDAGRAAISGKTFRRISPAFHADAAGKITGAPANMGGFVNRAAFRTIAPLFAKENPEFRDPKLDTTTMNEDEMKALQEENTTLKAQLDELQKQLAELNQKDAEAAVEMAAKEGRIGTDPALKAKWVASIVKDATAKDLLLAMAPNPTLISGKIVDTLKAKEAPTEETPEVLLAKYEALPRAEQDEFFSTHRAALTSLRR
jgi:hypothetical protein